MSVCPGSCRQPDGAKRKGKPSNCISARENGKNEKGTIINMLHIFFGDMPEAIYNTSVYFRNTYKDSWITKKLSVEMIRDIDKSIVVNETTIESPIFGMMSPTQLSGGTKALLLIANDKKHVFNASNCGDNCAKWLLKIAEKDKIVVNLRHLMDFGDAEFKIMIENTGKLVRNMRELVFEAGELV